MPHTRKEILQWGQHMADRILHRKHQEPEEVTIKGWVARNKYGALFIFFKRKPEKIIERGCWFGDPNYIIIQGELPSVQWSDPEPTPATITIKIEK